MGHTYDDGHDRDERHASTLDLFRRRIAATKVSLLAALIVSAPLLVGGGPPWAQLTTIAMGLAVFAVAIVRIGEGIRWDPFATPLAFAALVTAAQLVPVPAAALRAISPHAVDLREEAAGRLLNWCTMTLDVPATSLALAAGVGALLVYLSATVVARRHSRVYRVAMALGLTGALLALVTAAQRLTGLTGVLGLYTPEETPGGGPFGTFINNNHAASFFALSALCAAGAAIEGRGLQRVACWGAGILSGISVIATGSRAGALGLFAGVFLFLCVLLTRSFGFRRALTASAAATVGLAATAIVLGSTIRARLGSLAESLLDNQKVSGWLVAGRMTLDYPWTGVGRGAFEAPATAHRLASENVRLAYPENFLLQLLSEWGLVATAAFLYLCARPAVQLARRLPRMRAASLGAACAVVAVLIHEAADFGLEVTGVAIPFLVALALANAPDGARQESGGWHARMGYRWLLPALAIGIVSTAMAASMLPRLSIAERRRLHELFVTSRGPDLGAALRSAIERHPADYYLEMLAAAEAGRRGDPRAFAHINRAQHLFPANGKANLLAAQLLAKAGRRSQAAVELRLARVRGVVLEPQDVLDTVGVQLTTQVLAPDSAALMQLARVLLARKDVRAAQAISRQAVEVAPSDANTIVARFELAASTGDEAFAAEAAASLMGVVISDQTAIAAARTLERTHRPMDAERLLRTARGRAPGSLSISFELIRLYIDMGKIDDGRALLQSLQRSSSRKTAVERAAMARLDARMTQLDQSAGAVRPRITPSVGPSP